MQVDANGARLWFDVAGEQFVPDGAELRERPTVVLLHGGPGSYDHSYFKPDHARLARDAQVVTWTCEDMAVRAGPIRRTGASRSAPMTSGHSATPSASPSRWPIANPWAA